MPRDYKINTFSITKMTAIMTQQVLNYSTKYINKNYRIKVAGVNDEGQKINTLVGVSGLLALISVELANKFIRRAEHGMEDACYCRLRRGLRITFYNK
nr:MAG TPA: hypothetical protein [Caudoviricetes sp.]